MNRDRDIRFSVILPAQNEEEDLPEAIESVLHQTYGNFELIVVDGASGDRTGAIADHYAGLHKDIRVIHNEKDPGRAGARNQGLMAAGGDYCLLLDADDTYEPNLLFRLREELEKDPADVITYSYSSQLLNNKGQIIRSAVHTMAGGSAREEGDLHLAVKKMAGEGAYLHVWNKAYSLPFLRKYAVSFQEIPQIEDALFTIDVFDRASSVSFLPDILYHCRGFAEGPRVGKFLKDYLPLHIRRVISLKDQFDRFGVLDEEGLMILSSMYFKSLASALYRALRHGTGKAELLDLLDREFATDLFATLSPHYRPTGKGDRYLRAPLARGEGRRAIRRQRRLIRLEKFQPDLYARYIL